MSTTAGAAKIFPFRGTGRGGRVILNLDVNIGAAGAATYARQDDPGLTCAKNTTGVYDVTFPKCRLARIKGNVMSPLMTVIDVVVTAIDPALGTATIKTTHDDATATEPASGDKIWLEFSLDTQSV